MVIALLLLALMQSVPPPVGVEVFRGEKGLNANALYGVLVDPSGFVWVHTDNGLYRYDGTMFKVAPSTVGREVVLANFVDSTTIAALSFDNTIDLIDIRRISDSRILSIPDSIKLNSFASTVRRFGDTLYVGTSERRVLRKVGEEWESLGIDASKRLVERVAMVEQTKSGPLFATSMGSWVMDAGRMIPMDTTIQLTSKPWFDGQTWWMSSSRHVFSLDEHVFRKKVNVTQLGIDGFVNQIAWRTPEEIWLATQKDGLVSAVRSKSGEWVSRQLLEQNDISGIAIDRGGFIWVTTLNHGLHRFSPWFDRLERVNPVDGLSESIVLYASEDVFISEFERAYRKHPVTGKWTPFVDGAIHFAELIGKDSLLIGQIQSTRIFNGHRFSDNYQESIKRADKIIQPPVKQASRYGNRVALAAPNGVYVMDLATSMLEAGFEKRATSVVLLDTLILIGRPNELEVRSIKSGDVLHHYNMSVTSLLHRQPDVVIVAGSTDGLIRYDVRKSRLEPVFQTLDAKLTSWESLHSLTDSSYAIVGPRGVFVIVTDSSHRMTSLHEVPVTPVEWVQSVRNVRLDERGMIWFATSRGAFKMPYSDLLNIESVTEMGLAEVRVDGDEVDPSQMLNLQSHQNRVFISLAMLGHVNLRFMVLEYRFGNSDSTWIPLSQPSIEIESIRNGHTTFTFRLRNVLTDEVLSSVSLVVYKSPDWWERPWVIALGLILGILTTVALTTLALRQSHRKKMDQFAQEDRVRELERVAITRLLTSHYLFNALATIRSVARRSTDEVNSYIGRLSKVIRALIDRTSQNEVDLKSELDWIHDYVALESVGRQLALRFEVSMDDELDPEEVVLPAFILQPIVENAMFHGAMNLDPVIRCDIRLIDRRLHIFIRNRIEPGSTTVEAHGSPSKGVAFMTERLKGWGRYHDLHLETEDVLRIRQTDTEWTIEVILPLVNHDLPLVAR